MVQGSGTSKKPTSLMNEYSSLLGDAVLRHRARVAEHSARIEAELASKVKSEFIANMSHELRTPLNTVIGFSKLLTEVERRQLKPADVAEYAGLISDAASHLLNIINDILDISKIQSGRYTLDKREINVDEILQASLASFKLIARDAQVHLVQRIDLDLPSARGDAVKLRQVFTNLINNAIKFTRPGGSVTVEGLKRGDDGVTVIIRDTGIGMSADEIRVALTPFGQVDATRSRWREGTGLGLPIARALVSLHGGKLRIKSEKNVGTEVSVHLPSRHHVTPVEARDLILGIGPLEPALHATGDDAAADQLQATAISP